MKERDRLNFDAPAKDVFHEIVSYLMDEQDPLLSMVINVAPESGIDGK